MRISFPPDRQRGDRTYAESSGRYGFTLWLRRHFRFSPIVCPSLPPSRAAVPHRMTTSSKTSGTLKGEEQPRRYHDTRSSTLIHWGNEGHCFWLIDRSSRISGALRGGRCLSRRRPLKRFVRDLSALRVSRHTCLSVLEDDRPALGGDLQLFAFVHLRVGSSKYQGSMAA